MANLIREAARRLGADRIIIMGRHEDRLAIARTFGATDEVREYMASYSTRVTKSG